MIEQVEEKNLSEYDKKPSEGAFFAVGRLGKGKIRVEMGGIYVASGGRRGKGRDVGALQEI